MNAKKHQKNELKFFKLKIQKKNSHWLINGKTYAECGFVERYFFDLYLHYKRTGETIDFDLNL